MINAQIRKSELIQVEGMKRDIGRPKITLVEVIKKDMSIKDVTERNTLDKTEWRKRRYVEPN